MLGLAINQARGHSPTGTVSPVSGCLKLYRNNVSANVDSWCGLLRKVFGEMSQQGLVHTTGVPCEYFGNRAHTNYREFCHKLER
eukprot:7202627-Pyramimonas_sp.AAC.2